MLHFTPSLVVGDVYWELPQRWPAVAGGILAALLVIVWMYPSQLRYVGLPWRWLLPSLRTAALLALLLSLLKPVAVRLATADERGALAVVCDRSRSMSIVDNTRTDAQRVELADALGRLAPGVRGGSALGVGTDLDRLHAAMANVRSAQDDLDFAMIAGRDINQRRDELRRAVAGYAEIERAISAEAAVIQDLNFRRALADLSDVPDAESVPQWKNRVPRQLAAATDALAHFRAQFDQHLYDTDPQVHQACAQVGSLSRDALVQEALLNPTSGLVAKLAPAMPIAGFSLSGALTPLELQHDGKPVAFLGGQPDGAATDLTGGLAGVASQARARAIVLFSDGRQVGGDARATAAMAPSGIPIFAVGVAAATPPRDIALVHVIVPSGAFIGDTVPVRAEIGHEGIDGVPVEVHLSVGGLPEQVHWVDLRAGQPAVVEFSFELKKEQAGVLKLTMWTTRIPGEATEANNRVERWMKVMPERMRVAVWSGGPMWDAQELCAMLERRGEIQLSRSVLGGAGPSLAMPPEEILRQDVIVLCDVPAAALSARQWDAVTQLVSERGGSVILVVGEHLPSEYSASLSTSALLPFAPSLTPRFRVWPGEQPAFRFVPDPDAGEMDVLKLSNDPLVAWRRWQELPPVFRFLQLPNMSEDKLRPGTRALLVEADSGAPVLLERVLGAGRTFLLCTNETWRWRLKVGGRDQDRFWRQLIHYAAQDPYFATSPTLALDTDQVATSPGAPIQVRARILVAPSVSKRVCRLQIFREGKAFALETLPSAGPAGSGRYEASILLPAGSYELKLGSGTDAVSVPVRVQQTDEAELADLSGDDQFLRRLAEASGGEFFRIEQIGRLPERLSAVSDQRSLYVDLRLWDSPYLFIFIVGCLAAEWALRKQCGLA
jgi:hypothetical protein